MLLRPLLAGSPARSAFQGGTLLTIGLTGGIATGKSSVSNIFRDEGAIIVDADIIARQVVAPGLPAYQGIVDIFGREILAAGGDIDRKKLGQIIFTNTRQKEKLNRIVHPKVKKRADDEIRQIAGRDPSALVILDVPLLFEAGMDKGLAEIIVVYAPEDIQVERLMAREAISSEQALSRIHSQMPIEEKRKLGTIVIDNSGHPADTRKQVLSVFRRLKKRAID